MAERRTKDFPVFDCDAHINDPEEIWDYVPESKKELVRQTYWRNDSEAWLNGETPVMGGGNGHFAPSYNPICIAGPQAKYPNAVGSSMLAGGGDYDVVFRAFEECGMVLGMHTFPAPSFPHPLGPDYLASPGELFTRAGTDSQTFSFVHEMQVWLAQVL